MTFQNGKICIFVKAWYYCLCSYPQNSCKVFFILLFVLVWLLIESGYYSRAVFISLGSWRIAKTAGWIRYVRVIQIGLIDTGSTYTSQSAVETSLRTRTALEIAQWALPGSISTCVCALRMLAVATILRVGFISLRALDCGATIRRWRLFEGSV